MGKDKKKSKGEKLSKKDRKALAAREAEIRAELEKRAAKKAAKKKGKKADSITPSDISRAERKKKSKGKKAKVEKVSVEDLGVMTIEAEAPIVAEIEDAVAESLARDEKIDPATGETRPEVIAEREAVRMKTRDELDAEIKARVQAKRAVREAEAISPEVARQHAHLTAKREADAEADAEKKPTAVEEVETERGRIFEAGESVAAEAEFAKPSENADERPDFETNGLNQYVVERPTDKKMIGYTRATTYIACLEDTSKLTEWKMRVLLEGVAAAEETGDYAVTAKIRELAHVRDLAIAKARKADRKGKLGIGDLAALTERAWSEFKKALNVIADDVFEIGGGREKATKGTDIHALTELYDREGIGAVGDLLTAGEITPADMADVEAYADAMRKLGAKIVERERVVVNDALKVAGRLDIVAMVKLPALHDPKTGEVIRPAESRARRRVIDVKTGKIEYGIGKLAQQLEMYAGSTGYDLETHEREDLKLDRTVGLVIHLPAGSGQATVRVVDLVAGRKGNKLAGEVRAWRNEGKRAANLKIDVLAEIDRTESEGE